MLARTPQSFRDLNGCRKTTGKGFGRGRNKPRGPPREETGGHARGGYRGTHAQALRPRPARRGPGPRPGPLLGSSTHQELEHVVDNRERRVSPPWAGPSLLRGGEGRSPPSTSGAPPAPAAPRPALAKPRPEAPRGARAPPGELSGTTAQTGRRREGENRVPSSAQLDSFEHSDSRSPVLKPEVNLGWGPEVCIY